MERVSQIYYNASQSESLKLIQRILVKTLQKRGVCERERERQHTNFLHSSTFLNLSLPSPQNFGMIDYLTHATTLHILILCFLIKQRNNFFYVKGRTGTFSFIISTLQPSNSKYTKIYFKIILFSMPRSHHGLFPASSVFNFVYNLHFPCMAQILSYPHSPRHAYYNNIWWIL
jgi:hypothetical protein